MNNTNNYSSLNLSKMLAENGCVLESEYWWHNVKNEWDCDIETLSINKVFGLSGDTAIKRWESDGFKFTKYFAYDLLWDVCIKYRIEFWGEGFCNGILGVDTPEITQSTSTILYFLQQDKKDEAEKYIIANCLFLKDK